MSRVQLVHYCDWMSALGHTDQELAGGQESGGSRGKGDRKTSGDIRTGGGMRTLRCLASMFIREGNRGENEDFYNFLFDKKI